MAANTLPPVAGFFFAAGFPQAVFFVAPGVTHLAATGVALYTLPDDAGFLIDFWFIFAAKADRLEARRASKASSSSNQPLLASFCVVG